MRHGRWLVLPALVGAMSVVSAMFFAGSSRAGVYGTCDGFVAIPPGGAQWEFCYQKYLGSQGTNAPLLIRVDDQISNGTGDAWYDHVRRVCQEWTAAAGPQNLRKVVRANDTTLLYQNLTDANLTNFCGTTTCQAVTHFCTTQQVACDDVLPVPTATITSVIVFTSRVRLQNQGLSLLQKRWVLSHETGHALGLTHSSYTTSVMIPPSSNPGSTPAFFVPSSREEGVLPPCSGGNTLVASHSWGVRCVYELRQQCAGWWHPGG